MPNHKNLPPLPDDAPGKNGFKYRQQHGIILVCKDEAAQIRLYEALTDIKASRIKVVVT